LGERLQAFREFTEALSFVEANGDEREPPPLLLPESEVQRALKRVPAGSDRGLVEEAMRERMHVFLTRDADVLRARPALRAFGLFIASPLDLLEEIAGCGALYCLADPRFAQWPLLDPARVAHLYHATLATEFSAGATEYREMQTP
jgi:hypothetical protein